MIFWYLKWGECNNIFEFKKWETRYFLTPFGGSLFRPVKKLTRCIPVDLEHSLNVLSFLGHFCFPFNIFVLIKNLEFKYCQKFQKLKGSKSISMSSHDNQRRFNVFLFFSWNSGLSNELGINVSNIKENRNHDRNHLNQIVLRFCGNDINVYRLYLWL